MTNSPEIYDTVLGTVGDTPLVRLDASPDSIPIFAKLEALNPGGSVKDRIGKYIIEKLIETEQISSDGRIIEPTAGNTGIGMALAATQYDVDVTFVVPESFSVEKQTLMQALGAELVRTPADKGIKEAIKHAKELAAEHDDAIVPQQFSTELNTEAHYQTTGPEIYDALDGNIGAVVMGVGTSGTLMGTAQYILEKSPQTQIIAVEPEGSMYGSIAGQDLTCAEYRTEGIGTSTPEINELFNPSIVDDVLQISGERVHAEMQRLPVEEGHLVGSSAAAASVAAQQVASQIGNDGYSVPHRSVVTLFPDSSERYLTKNPYGTLDEWKS